MFHPVLTQPQQPNVVQPAVNSQVASSVNSVSSGGGGNPTAFGTNVLLPQQQNMFMPVQPVSTAVHPQITGMGNIQPIQPSVSDFTDLSVSNPMQMHGAPSRVPMQGAGNIIDPRGHSSAAAVLLHQQPSMTLTPARIPPGGHTGMNTASATLFQQPLIGAPSVAQTSQGTCYKMAPGG